MHIVQHVYCKSLLPFFIPLVGEDDESVWQVPGEVLALRRLQQRELGHGPAHHRADHPDEQVAGAAPAPGRRRPGGRSVGGRGGRV